MTLLQPWNQIAQHYNHTLLVGNGASIALDSCFSYRSLFDTAAADNLITNDVRAVFDYFSTTDFEHVMRMLWHAFNVNGALGIGETRTRQAYLDLRRALIQTVQKSHVGFQAIEHHLDPIQEFLGRFATVLSLNYDLTLYWAMLEGNERRGGNWFKDCWLTDGFEGDWRYLAEPHQGVNGATLVFFPHGSLLFATHPEYGEYKIKVGDSANSLLDRIVSDWESNAFPMFVSEGESRQKEAAIARHGYLSSVYNDVMTDLGPTVVVYGWGMSDNDDHILKRIASRRVQRIAVSVLRGTRSSDEIEQHCSELKWMIRTHNSAATVEFFDASSPGCWKNR